MKYSFYKQEIITGKLRFELLFTLDMQFMPSKGDLVEHGTIVYEVLFRRFSDDPDDLKIVVRLSHQPK